METLCQNYWYPVYAFIRRRGYTPDQAEDLTQGFFSVFLEKGYVKQVDRERGRFRTFLLTSVKHYLANEWKRSNSQKRGGEYTKLDLDFAEAEAYLTPEETGQSTPETVFEQRWAATLLERTLGLLAREMNEKGQGDRFEELKPCLVEGKAASGYKRTADKLEMTEAAVKTAVHRMRHRFGDLLRAEIAETVADPGEVDDEIRYLFAALGP
jgi:RNA polymerase sigma-70 factor (ECF subfamily)